MMMPMPASRVRRHRLAEQPPRGRGVEHVAERQQRIGDRHVDARQPEDPDDDADDVAREAAEDRQLRRESQADRHEVRERVLERPDRRGDVVDARLQQQLRAGVEEHAEQDQREAGGIHARSRRTGGPAKDAIERAQPGGGLPTTTRRASRATTRIGRRAAVSVAKTSSPMIASGSRSAFQRAMNVGEVGDAAVRLGGQSEVELVAEADQRHGPSQVEVEARARTCRRCRSSCRGASSGSHVAREVVGRHLAAEDLVRPARGSTTRRAPTAPATTIAAATRARVASAIATAVPTSHTAMHADAAARKRDDRVGAVGRVERHDAGTRCRRRRRRWRRTAGAVAASGPSIVASRRADEHRASRETAAARTTAASSPTR